MSRRSTDDLSARVADRLRRLRRDRGLTQAQLAEEAGLAVETLSRIEQQRELPSLRTLDRLAGALEIPVDVLVRIGGALPTPPRPSRLSAEARQLLRLVEKLDQRAIRHLIALARMLGDSGTPPPRAGPTRPGHRSAPRSAARRSSRSRRS